ncbi:unnamed protein product [Rotaria sp. Silwood2]|nr:unnamed protein product [Rotaria sp. Silwood2]CAF3044705.1 unnamed protein product [Rotaria sp. Silwood2]
MEYDDNRVSLMKKSMFSYFSGSKRPGNVGIRKRWEDKIIEDLEKFGIKNWRKDTRLRDKWRQLINQNVGINPAHVDIKNILLDYKKRTQKRRSQESAAKRGIIQRKVAEILNKDNNNYYTCPKCGSRFKPQGITGHVKSCAKLWCKKHKITLK